MASDHQWLLMLVIQYGYLLMFCVVVLDHAGLPLPGELLLIAFGFLARSTDLDAGLGVVVAAVAAMTGASTAYWLGRLGGLRLVRIWCWAARGSSGCVDHAVAFYLRFGPLTVVLGRFVVGLRALLIPLAGSAGLPYGRFLVFDAIGALLWSALFIAIGFTAGQYAESLGHWLRGAPMLLGAALAAVLAGSLTVKLARRLYGLARGRRAPGGSCKESVAQGGGV